jgi:hypothetical protein
VSAITHITVTPTNLPNRVVCGEVDPIIEWAMNRNPQQWFDDIMCHGNENGKPTPTINEVQVEITAEQLAVFITAQPDFGIRPIRLLMCWVGRDADGFAQQLANLLRVPVLAPPCRIDTEQFATELPTERFRLFMPE